MQEVSIIIETKFSVGKSCGVVGRIRNTLRKEGDDGAEEGAIQIKVGAGCDNRRPKWVVRSKKQVYVIWSWVFGFMQWIAIAS
ncbi:hypothetical protein A3860_02055 [Niastella vici]|uniref:Uncharacterized protein n=1 Tax=Niastella vici TaxID=1703345 RepID=A0A1V9G9N0_9BACT|nr:hypothetical protein A3860_02055 [Niastella vici]